MTDMQDRESVQTKLQAIAEKAGNQPGYRFRNLYGMLNAVSYTHLTLPTNREV